MDERLLDLLAAALAISSPPRKKETIVTTEWTVICKPTDDDDVHGLVVLLTHGEGQEHEVARVAYDRGKSKDPDTPFAVKLDAWILDAKAAADKLNELDAEYELLSRKSRDEAGKQVRKILGPKPRSGAKPE